MSSSFANRSTAPQKTPAQKFAAYCSQARHASATPGDIANVGAAAHDTFHLARVDVFRIAKAYVYDGRRITLLMAAYDYATGE